MKGMGEEGKKGGENKGGRVQDAGVVMERKGGEKIAVGRGGDVDGGGQRRRLC